MAKRQCKGKNAKGKPCGAHPLKPGTEIEGVKVKGKHCKRHDPDLPASARFGSRAQATAAGKQGGRPPKPKVVEILRERFEERADEFLAVLDEALTAQEPYTVGWGEDAYLEMVPDHRTRLKALEMAFNHVYGKPKQATEIVGAEGGPVEIVPVTRAEAKKVGGILAGVGAGKDGG